MKKWKKTLGWAILFFAIITIGSWISSLHYIRDSITVWQNQLTDAIREIAETDTMTDDAKRIFFATKPELASRDDFNKNCETGERDAMILGCYTPEDRIYIYQITDEKVKDSIYSTSAHEMLHAAYMRLGTQDRENVNFMLEQEYNKLKDTDPDLVKVMNDYEKSEPGEKDNELHSILATEYHDLSSDLEKYYAKYFNDRQQVVDKYDTYKRAFDELEQQRENLSNLMNEKNILIKNLQNEYQILYDSLTRKIEDFNACAQTLGCFASQSVFDSTRTGLLDLQTSLTTKFDKINTEIDTYNNLVQQFNDLGGKMQKLSESMNSKIPQL